MCKYDLRKLQETELGILIDFDLFCRKNSLQYYLIGGALLGAVRYGKFIPWDNDIDIAMPRDAYERVKEIYFSDKYFLQNTDTDQKFARGIQKLRLNGTEIIEKVSENVKMHNGIYIDIFPIDYIEHFNFIKIAIKAKKIRKLMSLRAIKSGYLNGRFSFIKKIIKKLYPITCDNIDNRIDKLCIEENHLKRNYAILYLHNYCWKKQLHKADVFGEGINCNFEGYEFIAPSNPNCFLRRVFGEEYMKEPPVEKQKQPHNYISVKYNVRN